MNDQPNEQTKQETPASEIDRKKVEALVDNKILEAKLTIAEGRVRFLLYVGAAALTIFGIILPLLLTSQSTERVDKAIERMEDRFNELAGTQLRRPDLEGLIDGKALENTLLTYSKEDLCKIIAIKNTGDGTAENIQTRLYLDIEKHFKDGTDPWPGEYGGYIWEILDIKDEPGFLEGFQYGGEVSFLDPKNSYTVPVCFGRSIHVTQDGKSWIRIKRASFRTPALLKIYYGQPEPKRIPFTIVVEGEEEAGKK